ncbi:MAG TPA: alpha-amylase family glycosyl hydrolase, partial [Candidatus Syntrophosphaera sp.]|nr:alpha-amylase family glycosyl hydrolase [Candidatus Syntrophosphaera sp.]
MRIYNLFPRLTGTFQQWTPHIERAGAMGFDWVFVNPIQQTGKSRSLYSLSDYFGLNPDFCDPSSSESPEQQLKSVVQHAERCGIRMMVDLVINHCAFDSALVKERPHWFLREHDGNVAHPFCMEDGRKVVWKDLARFDHRGTSDRDGLHAYFLEVIEYLVGLGFKGFRCDAAYQLPRDLWQKLISRTKRRYPDTVFAAETLGCTADRTKQMAQAGFDYVFNSSKWWDFGSPWLLEQYHLVRESAPSISFPAPDGIAPATRGCR